MFVVVFVDVVFVVVVFVVDIFVCVICEAIVIITIIIKQKVFIMYQSECKRWHKQRKILQKLKNINIYIFL